MTAHDSTSKHATATENTAPPALEPTALAPHPPPRRHHHHHHHCLLLRAQTALQPSLCSRRNAPASHPPPTMTSVVSDAALSSLERRTRCDAMRLCWGLNDPSCIRTARRRSVVQEQAWTPE
eukprot:3308815-Rhodomonas_salina.3